MYTLLRSHKDQKVYAENVQTALMAIEGLRDESVEVPNDRTTRKWQTAGVFDDQDGLLYLRNGDQPVI